MRGSGNGNGNGFVSDAAQRRLMNEAIQELLCQQERGKRIDIPECLLTPDGLRRIVAMTTRGREIESWVLELLQFWVVAYRERHP